MHEYYVYLLRCRDHTFYTGVTNDYLRRFEEHQRGDDPTCYTFSRRPLKLVHIETYQWIWDALEREKQMKCWSRAKKTALTKGDMHELEKLSRNANYDEYMKKKCPSTSSGRHHSAKSKKQ